MNTTGPTSSTESTFDGVPLQLTPHTMIDVGNSCPADYGVDVIAGRHEVGELIECPGCLMDHVIVAAVPVDVAENLTIIP